MTHADITAAVAAEHLTDQLRAANTSRLTAALKCCRPSSWQRTARDVQRALAALVQHRPRRAQATRAATGSGVACCA